MWASSGSGPQPLQPKYTEIGHKRRVFIGRDHNNDVYKTISC